MDLQIEPRGRLAVEQVVEPLPGVGVGLLLALGRVARLERGRRTGQLAQAQLVLLVDLCTVSSIDARRESGAVNETLRFGPGSELRSTRAALGKL